MASATEEYEGEEREPSSARESAAEWQMGDDAGELTDAEVEAGETRRSGRNED
jgi:hypothetical protein